MIDDVSRTLEALLDDGAVLGAQFPELLAANVVFDRPDQTFSPSAPASLDLFLFDIRENLDLRSNEPIVEYLGGGQTVVRKPPRRVDCSYLVTAWPVGPAPLSFPEQKLLGQALQVLGRHPKIPATYLQGVLVGQEPPLPMLAPQIDGLKSPADFWAAMGNQLRASFTVTVTVSVPLFPDVTGPQVVTVHHPLDFDGVVPADHAYRIGGRVTETGSGSPIAGAEVRLVETNQSVATDDLGRFSFGLLSAGSYNLEVTHPAFADKSKAIVVPGATPTAYDVEMAP